MILYPKAYFKSVKEINVDFLKQNNIKALILDVDNTLIDFEKKMPEGTREWAKELKRNGIKLQIVSNTNKKAKVEEVAAYIGDLESTTRKYYIAIRKKKGNGRKSTKGKPKTYNKKRG